MPSVVARAGVITAPFPTTVSGFVGTATPKSARAPVSTTSVLPFVVPARLTPTRAAQNGTAAVPPLVVVEHPVLFSTYTVSASVAQWPSMLAMHTPGFPVAPSFATHSASALQARHVFALLQMGSVAVLQSLLAAHWTQAPPAGPLVAHTARLGSAKVRHSLLFLHAWHLLALSQMGEAPEQLALVVHWTQALLVVLQTGVLPLHWALPVH